MKNVYKFSGCMAIAAVTAFVGQPAGAQQVVFANTNTFAAHFATASLEVGNEITLAGSDREVVSFDFEYYLPSATGSETAEVKFYKNDSGTLFAGHPVPSTVLYDSGVFNIGSFGSTTGSTLNFNQADLAGGVLVPDDFTWTVQFGGLTGSEDVGVDLYQPPSVGTYFNDMWQNGGSGWLLVTNATYSLDIGAVATATPEPSASALLGLSGLLVLAGLVVKRHLRVA